MKTDRRAILNFRVPALALPLGLVVALSLGVTGCYTKLGASGSASQDAAAPTWSEAQAHAPGARVGLGGIADEEYVAEYGYEGLHDGEEDVYRGEAYYEDEYYYQDGYQEPVTVTRYHADDYYYDDYYGRSYAPTYVSYNYYYPRLRPYYLGRPHFRGAWSYYDPYWHRPRFSFHIGFSFGHGVWHDPYWSAAYWHHPFWYDPFLMWTLGYPVRPHWAYMHRPFHRHYGGWGGGWHGYHAGYSHGYWDGWHDGYFYGGVPTAGGSWTTGRSRGSVRSALNPDRNRDRRSALAAVTRDTRRLALDAPVGTRQARLLADDARQHVLVNRSARVADLGGERTRTLRSDDATTVRQPRVGTVPQTAPTRTTPPEAAATDRATRTAPSEGPTRTTQPATRQPEARQPATRQPETREPATRQPETRPERSRWDAPQRDTRQAVPERDTRQAAPQRDTRQAAPQRDTRQAAPQRDTRQAAPQRDRVAPQPPPRERARDSSQRDDPPPRSRPAPPPTRNDARQARPRQSGTSARSGRQAPREQARPAPRRPQSSARPSSSRPQPSARPSSSGSSSRGTVRSSGTRSNSQGSTRSGRGN